VEPALQGAAQTERAGHIECRFAELAGESWEHLPAPIRRRFSRHLAEGERIVYQGEVANTTLSWAGRLIAQLARIAGAPLPLEPSGRMPVAVLVTGCERLGGQVWTRIYDRARSYPQVIQSVKRFGGTTGLEEIVGCGIGMRLALSVRDRALVFRSAGYFVRCLGVQLSLPDWLTPGAIEVVHREESFGRFSFSLSVTHSWAGRIIEQMAFFREHTA
jgi:Domain of unknown function (DUF4166)